MFENEYRLQIMGSTALKGKAPGSWRAGDWAKYHKTFTRTELSPREMAIHVWRGFAFTPVFTEARREEFFQAAWHIALDFDSGDESSSLPFLVERPGTFAWMFASFGYSTPSSTDEHPRSRVVFILDEPITTPDAYRAAYAAVAWRMGDEGSATDPACKDPLRLYYGSPGCKVSPNWSALPGAALGYLVAEHRAAHPPAPPQRPAAFVPIPPDAQRVNGKLAQLGRRVAGAAKGERHTTLLKTARLAGGYVASGALDEAAVVAELTAASRHWGDDEAEIERVIRDGLANGKGQPLQFTAASSLMGMLR
jgi:hypothetical protein